VCVCANFDVLKYPFYNNLIFKLVVFQFRVLLFCWCRLTTTAEPYRSARQRIPFVPLRTKVAVKLTPGCGCRIRDSATDSGYEQLFDAVDMLPQESSIYIDIVSISINAIDRSAGQWARKINGESLLAKRSRPQSLFVLRLLNLKTFLASKHKKHSSTKYLCRERKGIEYLNIKYLQLNILNL